MKQQVSKINKIFLDKRLTAKALVLTVIQILTAGYSTFYNITHVALRYEGG